MKPSDARIACWKKRMLFVCYKPQNTEYCRCRLQEEAVMEFRSIMCGMALIPFISIVRPKARNCAVSLLAKEFPFVS